MYSKERMYPLEAKKSIQQKINILELFASRINHKNIKTEVYYKIPFFANKGIL